MRDRKKSPRKPLEDALFFIAAAQQIILRLYRAKSFQADEYDFALLERIADACDRTGLVANHAEICLLLRAKGAPEPPLPEHYRK